MLQIGRFNTLTLTRFTDHGAYVDGGDVGEILVPKAYVRPEWRPGDTQRLFVYLDQSERLVATTESPLAQVGDFACLEVAWVNEHGAFLSWGVMKDLFVPFREQRRTMEVGEHHVVYVYIDEATGRLAATAKVDRYLRPAPSRDYHRGRTVQLLAWQRSPLGMKVIVDNAYAGLIYAGEAYDRLPRRGEVLEGTVVQLRPTAASTSVCSASAKGVSAILPTCSSMHCAKREASCPSPTAVSRKSSPSISKCRRRRSNAPSARSTNST